MTRCPVCDHPLPEDRDRVGARCPTCRDPLYEPPGRIARPAREGEAACPVHAGMESVGVCLKCNQAVCETCRTRWRGQVWCAGCVDQALTAGEGSPEELRVPLGQARRAVGLGLAAWLAAGVSLLALREADRVFGSSAILATFAVLVLLAGSVLLAAAGMGQALAALRAGVARPLALIGLALAGGYVGVALGVGAIGLWQN